ncbi:MAG: AbrB/MazE/SpoVT family DNA-binding domain-containing protein [archaeon GB-1867-035]|nr:AbrB/MazE/SpoVT family DNA-binding domain-containing protein [Candidatus Culexmicrobium profundum]
MTQFLPFKCETMFKTVVSKKGQVVIPKNIREMLGLTTGTILKVSVEKKKIILEPIEEPPKEIFIEAGSKITEKIIREAKTLSDKTIKLLKDLGVEIE